MSTLATPQTATITTWNIDPVHSVAEFKVKHMMISNVKGQFTRVNGVLTLNETDLSQSHVEASIEAASINTRDEQRDGHLKSADFFDAEKFPTLSFKSTRVSRAGDGELKVTGDLTIHGVTKPVVLVAHFVGSGVNPVTKTYTVGFDASTVIKRGDFGISAYLPVLGGDVKLKIAGAFETQS